MIDKVGSRLAMMIVLILDYAYISSIAVDCDDSRVLSAQLIISDI